MLHIIRRGYAKHAVKHAAERAAARVARIPRYRLDRSALAYLAERPRKADRTDPIARPFKRTRSHKAQPAHDFRYAK